MAVESPPLSCPRCRASVTAGARFCANCGQALTDATLADAEAQTRLTAAAPAPLIEKMRAARLTGERKPVTALFADVVGSTALAEQIDPEDWTAMINEAFDVMSRAIFRYEGTIAQLQGDAMLAFFGAPVAHEDDPERAVLAALDMLAATDEFARQLKATHGIDFRIRAGINTGPVMVGRVGSDLRYEYTALGDAVNVAARMQAAAQPQTILITEMTRRLTGDTFDLEDLGGLAVKGKTEPIRAYRVIGRKVAPARRRGLEAVGLASPMVGRDEPLRRLEELFEIVGAGRGRAAFVIGEPGIGKSRLLAELRGRVVPGEGPSAAGPGDRQPAPPRVTWVEGHCVSYGASLPYHLLIDLVRSVLGLPFVGSDAEIRERLDQALGDLLRNAPEWIGDTATYIAHLLSLPLRAGEEERESLGPDVVQSRYVAAVHRLLRALTERGPVVLTCEDLHWADPASIDVVGQMMPLATQLPVLFVGALRAETDSSGWTLIAQARELFGDALTEIRLEPLSETDSRALVANLLEIESLPDHAREVILARAEGNPFFVEEVVRMLIERGAIVAHGDQWVATADVGGVDIPENLHGLLLARIDQLPEAAKRSLRVAAVIGRQFPLRVLERIVSSAEAPVG
jgi:class 3 adenylate cyclase